jgi:deoxyribodipyrimidine photo-lyase
MTPRVMWFRRDLRLRDNPALVQACAAPETLALFVLDPALWGPAGDARRIWLIRSLRALDESLGGALVVRHGDPVAVVPHVAREAGAAEVHIAADFGPYGRRRDEAVDKALSEAGITLTRTGSPYAVAPGRISKDDGTPYRVFTPFSHAWARHGWRQPPDAPEGATFVLPVPDDGIPAEPDSAVRLPAAGEDAARERWTAFRDERLADYATDRDRPDLAGTSAMSAHLKYGEVHPRTLLADLATRTGPGPDTYRTELAWREFYADVVFHAPASTREHYRRDFAAMRFDEPGEGWRAWCAGRTGFPFVDAGMRQLLTEGWMHNRVRMVVASFLVKDLHVAWQHGARFFLQHLRDGDLASNNHGWQWAAGSGTDAAPYFRVFNPVSQGLKFDPEGDYVRRYVPELRSLAGRAVHEPWKAPSGAAPDYPAPIVDHAAERREALKRYEDMRR